MPDNLLIIMDDEHSASVLGCYGHPIVQTPHLDAFAARGTRFENAYCNSPICVPSRAIFATGEYCHRTGYWDNTMAYDGRVDSWGHSLRGAGIPTTSIGKLHYVDNGAFKGFDEELLPMYLLNFGDKQGLVREPPRPRPQCRMLVDRMGPGETEYTHYDRRIRDDACAWLRQKAGTEESTPWVTFVSFISPHYPLVAPEAFYNLYDPARIPLPKQRIEDRTTRSGWWQAFEDCYIWDRFFESDAQRQIAIAAYYGLISFMDDNIGQILNTLAETGLDATTRVLFLSDHGECLGARGLWGKSVMYDESVKVPMILAGPGIPRGRVCRTPVSMIDAHPTILTSAGLAADPDKPGTSLVRIANQPDDMARPVMSEYHATASTSAEFMIRRGRYKYIFYLGFPPELYDLEADPEELVNLALDPAYSDTCSEFEKMLRQAVDPEKTDAAAKADQAKLLAQLGGIEAVWKMPSPGATPAPKI